MYLSLSPPIFSSALVSAPTLLLLDSSLGGLALILFILDLEGDS